MKQSFLTNFFNNADNMNNNNNTKMEIEIEIIEKIEKIDDFEDIIFNKEIISQKLINLESVNVTNLNKNTSLRLDALKSYFTFLLCGKGKMEASKLTARSIFIDKTNDDIDVNRCKVIRKWGQIYYETEIIPVSRQGQHINFHNCLLDNDVYTTILRTIEPVHLML